MFDWLRRGKVKEIEPVVTEEVEVSPKDSKEPWIDINGRATEDGRIELKADWNDAFIDFLRMQGLDGANEEVIVQQYIAIMHRQLMDTGVDFE
jgi:hypothetical protein